MQITIKITRPEGNTEPIFYEIEDSRHPGCRSMMDHLISKGLMTCVDSISGDHSEITRTLTFISQLELVALKYLMMQRFPEYSSDRESYSELSGHTVTITQSKPNEERFINEDEIDEDTLEEIRDIISMVYE